MTRLAVRGAALCAVTALTGVVAWHAPAGTPLAVLAAGGGLYVFGQAVRAGAAR